MRQGQGTFTGAFFRHVCQTSTQPLGIVVAKARGTKIWDVDGREYLDLLSGMGVANVGHAHPEVVQAIHEQSRRYLHTSVYGEMAQQPQVLLARRLARLVSSDSSPGGLSVTYFVNSGTEAVEGALKVARKFTGRSRLVAF
ncbi:MAG: aminotransferase class III-fold pyridoxal phosphate-dependent enzyme, partial [Candidatus Binatia bacterium]